MTRRVRNFRARNYVTGPALTLLASAVAICALVCSGPTPRRALFVWNASASAPVGLYRVVREATVSRGDLILAIPDPSIAIFAAERGYLPIGVPLIKRIAAVERDTVCGRGDGVFLNGHRVAARLATDHKGRPLPFWTGCLTLGSHDVFLLMASVPDSFDGRYFGATKSSAIAGRLVPLWTR